MPFRNLWKNLINRYSFNFFALIGFQLLVAAIFLIIYWCIMIFFIKIIPESILGFTICNRQYTSPLTIKELLDNMFFILAFNIIQMMIISFILSFLLYWCSLIINKLFKFIVFDLKNKITSYFVFYFLISLIYFFWQCKIYLPGFGSAGNEDVLVLYACFALAIIVFFAFIIYIFLLLLEINKNFRIKNEVILTNKYYNICLATGGIVSFVLIIWLCHLIFNR